MVVPSEVQAVAVILVSTDFANFISDMGNHRCGRKF